MEREFYIMEIPNEGNFERKEAIFIFNQKSIDRRIGKGPSENKRWQNWRYFDLLIEQKYNRFEYQSIQGATVNYGTLVFEKGQSKATYYLVSV